MVITYLKRAVKTSATGSKDFTEHVQQLLEDLKTGCEAVAVRLAEELAGWTDPIVVNDDAKQAAIAATPQQIKDDIAYAYERVKRFAEKQRETLVDFEVELAPGQFAGQKQIPIATAGCYVPGGRYAQCRLRHYERHHRTRSRSQQCNCRLTCCYGTRHPPGDHLRGGFMRCGHHLAAWRCAGGRIIGLWLLLRYTCRYGGRAG